MADMAASLSLDARGNVSTQLSKWTQGIDKFSKVGRRSLRTLAGASRLASKGLARLGNRYTALAGGAAGAGSIRYLVGLDARITQLGVQANKSADAMNNLKSEIFAAAQNKKIRIDPAEMIAAVEKIVEKTGDLDLARENIEVIGMAIRATGAAGQDVGALIADMSEKFAIRGKDEFLATLDAVVNQGKAGAFTLKNLATQGERVTAAYALLGRTGPGAVKEMGAMLQMIKRGVGGPEQAATALEALIRTLNDAESRKKIFGAGIKIIDPSDPERMRSVIDIVKDLVTATKGDAVKLSTVFDAEAMRAFSAAIIEYNQTGGFASFDKFLNVQSTGASLIEDSTRNAKTASAALGSLFIAWKKFSDENLTGPIKDLAETLDGLGTEKVDTLVKSLGYGAAALGAFIVASKVAGGVSNIRNAFGKKGGSRTAAASGIGAPMPVIVTNWPRGGSAGLGTRGGKSRTRGGKTGKLGKLGKVGELAKRGSKLLGRVGAPVAAIMYGVDFAGAAFAGDKKGMAGSAGGAGGALAGAAAGALIGSVVPIIGTAIGGIIGSILGGLGGEQLGRMMAGNNPATEDRKDKFDGTLKVQIESDRPAHVKELSSSNSNVDIEVDTGLIMAGGG